VLLLEAVPPALDLLSAPQVLGATYDFLTPSNPEQPYYVAILLDKKRVKKLSVKEIAFPTTRMGRQLLAATVEFPQHGGPPLVLSTAHLESTKGEASERKKQLGISMRFLQQASRQQLGSHSGGAALLAGDLNLRDEEVKAVQRDLQSEAAGIIDAWSFCGSPADARWTFDTTANHNSGHPMLANHASTVAFFLAPEFPMHLQKKAGDRRASS